MDFGEYLTYDEYRKLGGTLEQMPFNLLEFESRRRIDIRTQNRLKDSSDVPDEVKMCIFALINSMSNYDKSLNNIASNGNVASENTDGYSVSYITTNQISDIVKSKSAELDDIIETYLMGVVFDGEHLMYLGVN